MNKPDKKQAPRLIAENRKARYDYFIEERFEAGLVLEGWEVKSMRAGKAQIAEGYVYLKNGEAFLFGAQITPLNTTSTHVVVEPKRTRKLLLSKVGIVAPAGQRRAPGLYARAPRLALEERPRKAGGRPCQGQEATRQTGHRKRSRLATRQGAHPETQLSPHVVGDREVPGRKSCKQAGELSVSSAFGGTCHGGSRPHVCLRNFYGGDRFRRGLRTVRGVPRV